MRAKAPLILGHRGYRARYPENTLLAFRKAFEAGADGVECDVQKSRDGRYVIAHDPGTKRVTGVPGAIAELSFEELRRLDFGGGERIPELPELLDAIPSDKYLDLELKGDTIRTEDCPAIAKALDARIERRRLMISSFEATLLMPFRKRGFTVGYLMGEETVARGAASFAGTLLRLRPQYLNLPIQMTERIGETRTLALLRFFRAVGFSLLFWTVNTTEQAAFVQRESRIIVSDEVERLVAFRNALTAAQK
jgi:glycerophosphoryl diester phosphodiesterase